MNMCPKHNNFVGQNTACPDCVAGLPLEPRQMTRAEESMMALLAARSKDLFAVRQNNTQLKVGFKLMKWAAVAGWACTILLLAFGDKL